MKAAAARPWNGHKHESVLDGHGLEEADQDQDQESETCSSSSSDEAELGQVATSMAHNEEGKTLSLKAFGDEKLNEGVGVFGRFQNWLGKKAIEWVARNGVPSHVAFIMDGNRRFAKSRGMERLRGHSSGFESLLRVLKWCLDLGTETVTVFAFSIENFKRSEEEVKCLMDLAIEKFGDFLDHEHMIMQNGIRVRVLGDLSLLPKDVQRVAAKVVVGTRENSRATLNICFAYSSGEEVSRAVRRAAQGVRQGWLDPEDVDEDFLSKCMYTRGHHPQLLIRTSGEIRLSDFMVWQADYTHFCFLAKLWPELSVWDIVGAIRDYQIHAKALEQRKALTDRSRNRDRSGICNGEREDRQRRFLEKLEEEDLDFLHSLL